MEKEYIKIIFGLKLKQIRAEKSLSLLELSKLSGLSKSYLNEIEKGKKYPKPDKVLTLSEKLGVPYDQLVSLKLDKNLAPVGELLRSRILKEIPLDLFGIQESDLIDIVSNAPIKVNTFISTIIQITKHYNVSRESFFLASVRSFQEANNNYFHAIETKVQQFCKDYHFDINDIINSDELLEILMKEYHYSINEYSLSDYKALVGLRTIFIPKTKMLLLANDIDEAQRTFIFAKEIAYNYMNIEKRLYTFPWVKFEIFDEVLNNFYASYFAGALVIPINNLTEKLRVIFKKKKFQKQFFIKSLESFNASPETFYRRLTNVLPHAFNIKDLFFLRFSHFKNSKSYELEKELHLSHYHAPKANEVHEHYCRRWVSLKSLDNISLSNKKHEFDIQFSYYPDVKKKYLVFSSATPDPFTKNKYRSVSIGLLLNKQLEQKINFLNDSNITTREVGVTCERCSISDCTVRQAPAKIIDKHIKDLEISKIVDELNAKFQR
ncbi:hypothetical protein GCM10009117_25390 [Gangjinia marincola]|uniref:HTH cro/C1-type domain-containing protein n=1 Tax=Gangjinia marincola TaxID=578463 RepID=A0ABN1MKE9_9FLAO